MLKMPGTRAVGSVETGGGLTATTEGVIMVTGASGLTANGALNV